MTRDITQLYCERTTLAFWAEPFNAISNVAFVIAAVYIMRTLLRHDAKDNALWLLAIIITLIGCGSFVFHTGPTLSTFLADVIPIVVFILASFSLVLKHEFQLNLLKISGAILLLFITMLAFRWFGPSDFRIGISFLFTPVVILLGMLSFIITKRDKSPHTRALARLFGAASFIFGIAVITRALDTPLCSTFPHGLHFAWHVLNAVVCYIIFLACFEIKRAQV